MHFCRTTWGENCIWLSDCLTGVFVVILWCELCVLHWSFLLFVLFLPFFLSPVHSHVSVSTTFASSSLRRLSLLCGSDLKDIHNNKHRYLLASENQRPGNFSTAPMGCLTASPSSGSLCSQAGLQSVSSIQERIMSTPGGEEAIERLKVHKQAFYKQKTSQGLKWISISWRHREASSWINQNELANNVK